MDITFRFPDSAIEALSKKDKWNGQVYVVIDQNSTIRKYITKKRKTEARKQYIVQDFEQEIISVWNNHPYVQRDQNGDRRNNPLSKKDISVYKSDIKWFIDTFGADTGKKEIERYLESCSNGNHIWNNANHGYMHLGGFLRALRRYHKTKTSPWWYPETLPEINDRNKELTEKIANAFAKSFLNRSKFGLENPSAEYRHFSKAARWIKRFEGQSSRWTEDILIQALMSCLQTSYGDSDTPVHTSKICSNYTWKTLMPQVLQ